MGCEVELDERRIGEKKDCRTERDGRNVRPNQAL
jgi:hypothetical protein